MKNISFAHKVSFGELIRLFKRRSVQDLILESSIGKGSVQVFKLEKGLQVRLWDCSFKEEIEMYNTAHSEMGKDWFTLAFFPKRQGIRFAGTDTSVHENIVWDIVFTSALSTYKMYLSPDTRGQCLSIRFSKEWFTTNVSEGNDTLKKLEEKSSAAESFLLFDSMASSEKKLILELLDVSVKKSLGSFYIKSVVLKLICDFFSRLKERATCSTDSICLDASITEIEKYLTRHITDRLPNLKDLACKFSVSESTLKRHFKKKYGVNMSTYFINKKMEHARQLIQEKNISFTEAAGIIGYKNVSRFMALFQKQYGALHVYKVVK